ncbi:hypothetical protein [Aeromicrobium sp.]|uniref:hypothetical protein n=1 Tax=Aeromicrobium sp. TaxID=1871063 RepID=UPI00198EAAFA|nr:hypothetical protein [Aeromicrobium sp.]MBC7631887.1 hypothetical protein [Aeromicrobium sp.]
MSTQLVALHKVQRRVAAIAFFAVAIHGVIGLIVVAHILVGQDRSSDATILILMSGAFAAVTYIGVRLILGKTLWAPAWIALAALPTIIAFFVVL